jgi:hypothetical protein
MDKDSARLETVGWVVTILGVLFLAGAVLSLGSWTALLLLPHPDAPKDCFYNLHVGYSNNGNGHETIFKTNWIECPLISNNSDI